MKVVRKCLVIRVAASQAGCWFWGWWVAFQEGLQRVMKGAPQSLGSWFMGHTIMERVLDPPKSPVQELPALGHSHHLLEPELLVSQMKILNKIDSRNLAASKGLVAELGNTFKAAPHCPLVASDYGPSKLRCPSIHPSIHLFFFPFKNTNRHSASCWGCQSKWYIVPVLSLWGTHKT